VSRLARVPLALLIPLASACADRASRGTRVDVPAPETVATPPSPPEPPASVVGLPVTVDLASLLDRVEDAVPRGQDREDDWHELGRTPVLGTVYVKEMWRRDPLQIALAGDRVDVTARVRYRARIAEKACLPRIGCRWVQLASCGQDDPMPTLRVGIRTVVRWREDWTLEPRTTTRPVEAGTPCRLTRARIDVTERVRTAVQHALDGVAPRVDRELRQRAELRGRLGELWQTLQEPVRVADSVYLQFRPDSVQVAPPAARGTRLGTVVSVGLRPRVVIGPRPGTDSIGLPPLVPGTRVPGFRVSFSAEVDYATASRLVNAAVVGRRIAMPAGRTLLVDAVRLYGNGRRLVLRVGLSGDARGTVYLEGTPAYDSIGRQVVVPDLDFTLESRHALAGPADWLLHDRLRDQLRDAAHFPVGDRMDNLHREVNGALERPLGRYAQLSGRIDAWHPTAIMVTRTGIATLGEASGEARVRVTLR
jgi:hypothetical protein